MAQQPGLFQVGQGSLQNISQEQQLANRASSPIQLQGGNTIATQQANAFQLGKFAGEQVGNIVKQHRFGGLTPDQFKRKQIIDKGKEKAKKIWDNMTPAQRAGSDAELRQNIFADEVAKAAFEAGDYELGGQITQQRTDRAQIREEKKRQLAKLDEDVETAEIKQDTARETLRSALEGPNLDNTAVQTYVDEEGEHFAAQPHPDMPGKLILRGGEEDGKVIDRGKNLKLDHYTKLQEAKSKLPSADGFPATLKERFAILKSAPWTTKELRDKQLVASGSMDVINDVVNIIQREFAAGRSGKTILAKPGFFLGVANNIKSAFEGISQDFHKPIATGQLNDRGLLDTTVLQGSDIRDLAKGNLNNRNITKEYGDLIANINIPDEFAANAAAYRSSMVSLAYSIARAAEPGARQLSDADFRNALQVVGAASGDPAVLQRVIMQLMNRQLKQIKNDVEDVVAFGTTGAGLTAEQSVSFMYGDPLEGFLSQFTQTQENVENLMTKFAVPVEQGSDLNISPNTPPPVRDDSAKARFLRLQEKISGRLGGR
jgi:hypothetical protein